MYVCGGAVMWAWRKVWERCSRLRWVVMCPPMVALLELVVLEYAMYELAVCSWRVS